MGPTARAPLGIDHVARMSDMRANVDDELRFAVKHQARPLRIRRSSRLLGAALVHPCLHVATFFDRQKANGGK
jgi:hypothetical protein